VRRGSLPKRRAALSSPGGLRRGTGRAGSAAAAWLRRGAGGSLLAWATVASGGALAAGGVGDTIPLPLAATPGDPARGRAIVASRQQGLCLLCHRGPFPEERFQGDLATDLTGAGSRWSAAQLRLRIVDSRRLQPDSIMPAFHRTDRLANVGATWRGKPILDAQQVEDVVAFLVTLK